jgi:hypothetical protein
MLGDSAAKALKIPSLGFPAQWTRYGRAAGPIRNQRMLDEGRPTMAYAFHDDIANSRGTKDMLERLQQAKIPHWLWSHAEGAVALV